MRNRVIFIVGPTATGKTKTAIALAEKIKGEIISCDSMQIYKYMPILSCSPSTGELEKVPHYLIGDLSPEIEYSAAEFSKKAEVLIKKIHKKNRTPIIVGGTGLYVKALIDGLFPSPEKDTALRKALESKAQKHGSKALYDELKKIDPKTSLNIHPNDTRRLIRAIEIYRLTGKPMSTHKKETKGIDDLYDICQTGIFIARDELYSDINKRVEIMFNEGIVSEVKQLLKFSLSMTAASAIGIKEIKDYIDGVYNLDETKELLKKHTRNYAKKQLTWFRQDKRIKWFNNGKDLISYCRSGE